MDRDFFARPPTAAERATDAIVDIFALRLLLSVCDVTKLDPLPDGVQFTLPADVAPEGADVVRVLSLGDTFCVVAGTMTGLEFTEQVRERGLGPTDLYRAISRRLNTSIC